MSRRRAGTALCLLGLLPACAPPPDSMPDTPPLFSLVEDGRVSTDRGASRGVGWADVDDDGDPDLVVANTDGQPNRIYLNLLEHRTVDGGARRGGGDRGTDGGAGRAGGDPPFEAFDPDDPVYASVVAAGGRAESATWVDYDGDGDLDLHMTTRGPEADLLFENQGGDGLRPVTEGALVRARSHTMACWADVDADGWLDVFLVGYRENGNAFFRNLGAGRFEPIADHPLSTGTGTGRACAWGDPNDDGRPDLVIGHAQEPNRLFWNRGGLVFEPETGNDHLDRHTAYTYGLSWADYDGDGDQDLFVANFDTTSVLYRNDGGGRLEPVIGDPIVEDAGGASKGHAWGDYDLDGDLDLFVANGTHGPDMRNFFYENRGGRFARLDEPPLTVHADTSAGAAWADYDRDGDLDLFVANWGDGDAVNRLYRNETADGGERGWIAFDLRGSPPNTRAWGAKVAIRATIGGAPVWSTRWLIPTTGYGSQNEPLVHFGLGDADGIDSLVVRWPSGRTGTHGPVGGRRVWRLSEGDPGDLLRPMPDGDGQGAP